MLRDNALARRNLSLPTERYAPRRSGARLVIARLALAFVFAAVAAAPGRADPPVLGLRRALRALEPPPAPIATPQMSKPAPPVAPPPASAKPSAPNAPKSAAPARETPVRETPGFGAAPPPSAPVKAPLVELPPLDPAQPPPMLPAATRERMRRCAEEWEKQRMGARATQPGWRDFATQCLTR